jgi:hypothetical protein
VSDGDGTCSSTQVPVVRWAWAHAAMSCRVRHLMPPFPEALALAAPTQYQKPPRGAARSLRASWAGGKRRNGSIGGEIMSVHSYRDDGVC